MSFLGAAKGEEFFFKFLDKKNCFIAQQWSICFDPHWYRIETGGDGAHYIDNVVYWVDSQVIEDVICFLHRD
jgi:hypothetical protein